MWLYVITVVIAGQWRIQDSCKGGRGRHGLTQQLFGKLVCKNERIWTLEGGYPPGSANADDQISAEFEYSGGKSRISSRRGWTVVAFAQFQSELSFSCMALTSMSAPLLQLWVWVYWILFTCSLEGAFNCHHQLPLQYWHWQLCEMQCYMLLAPTAIPDTILAQISIYLSIHYFGTNKYSTYLNHKNGNFMGQK